MIVLRNKTFTKRTPLQKLGIKLKYKVLRNLNITNSGTAGRIVKKGISAPISSAYTAIGPGGIVLGPTVLRSSEQKILKKVGLGEKLERASVHAGKATTKFVKKAKNGIQNLKDEVASYVQPSAGGQVGVVYY